MSGKWLKVLRFEITTLISRFSFWFGLVGVPLIGFVILGVATLINTTQVGSAEPVQQMSKLFSQPQDDRPQGFVDLSGLIKYGQGTVKGLDVRQYSSENDASQALTEGAIRGFYVIPADFIKRGDINYYEPEFNVLGGQSDSGAFERMIDYNLLQGDQKTYNWVYSPMNLQSISLAKTDAPERDNSSMLTFFLPYAVMMIFYIIILGTSSLMLSSISKEKENRVIESLLMSISPTEMLLGKIAGLGIIGLVQVFLWVGSGMLMLVVGGLIFSALTGFQLPISMIAWSAIFFILGYIVYASLMAGIGALAPNLKEGSQATTLVILPLMIPLFLISAIIQSPNGAVAVVLSIFPFTSPTTMMMRLSTVSVPFWQLALAVILLVLTAFLIIRMVAQMFRAQTLLSGQSFNIRRWLLAMVGKNP